MSANPPPFEDVIRNFAEQPDLLGVFVVGEGDRLTGVITRQDMLFWAGITFGPQPTESRFTWHNLVKLANATTAMDACNPLSHFSAVRLDDPLEQAFGVMLAHKLTDIPVVDKDGKILGDLRLSDLLTKALALDRAGKGARGTG